jgi:hypothetical protein
MKKDNSIMKMLHSSMKNKVESDYDESSNEEEEKLGHFENEFLKHP